MFMLLEAVHTYSLVAFVVKKNGMLTKAQNVFAGWILSIAVILIVASLQFENYGGDYHCWLRVDSPLSFGQINYQRTPSSAESTLTKYSTPPSSTTAATNANVPTKVHPDTGLHHPFNEIDGYLSRFPVGFRGCFACGSTSHFNTDDRL